MSYVGIIYNNKDRMIRRIIVPDNDEAFRDPKLVGPGETMTKVVRSVYNSFTSHAGLATSLGLMG